MTTIASHTEEFAGKELTIWYVDKERALGTAITTYATCAHCKSRRVYRFFAPPIEGWELDGWMIETRECRCAVCSEEFLVETEFEL